MIVIRIPSNQPLEREGEDDWKRGRTEEEEKKGPG